MCIVCRYLLNSYSGVWGPNLKLLYGKCRLAKRRRGGLLSPCNSRAEVIAHKLLNISNFCQGVPMPLPVTPIQQILRITYIYDILSSCTARSVADRQTWQLCFVPCKARKPETSMPVQGLRVAIPIERSLPHPFSSSAQAQELIGSNQYGRG